MARAALLVLACACAGAAGASTPQRPGPPPAGLHPVCFVADAGPRAPAFQQTLCETLEAALRARGHADVSVARVGDDRMADPARLFVVASVRDRAPLMAVSLQVWRRGAAADRIIPLAPIIVSDDVTPAELAQALMPLLRELGL